MKKFILLLVIFLVLIGGGCKSLDVLESPAVPSVPKPQMYKPPETVNELGETLVKELEYSESLLYWIFKCLKIIDEKNEDLIWLEDYFSKDPNL